MSEGVYYNVTRFAVDAYSCTYREWRRRTSLRHVRTCFHLRFLLGVAYENKRTTRSTAQALRPVKSDSPVSPTPGPSKAPMQPPARSPVVTPAAVNKSVAAVYPPLMKAKSWNVDSDPTDWWISELIGGERTFWDGTYLVDRGGKRRHDAPKWFTDALPANRCLDGALYAEKKDCEILPWLHCANSTEWKETSYYIFDEVDYLKPIEARMASLRSLLPSPEPWIEIVDYEQCWSRKHLMTRVEEVLKLGGEGMVLREANSKYIPFRSTALRKLKPPREYEADVIGYIPEQYTLTPGPNGIGSTCTALKCRDQSGKTWKLDWKKGGPDARDSPKLVRISSTSSVV